MRIILKRAAASVIPALVGLAIFPVTAMAATTAPHTSRAVAGPVREGRQTHERLVRLQLSATHRSRLAATASTAETTAYPDRPNGTFTTITVYPGPAIARFDDFYPGPGPVKGGAATGAIVFGKDNKIISCNFYANAGSGIDNSTGGTVGNGVAGTAGNSLGGRVFADVPPQ
jgi:hypothetical protein